MRDARLSIRTAAPQNMARLSSNQRDAALKITVGSLQLAVTVGLLQLLGCQLGHRAVTAPDLGVEALARLAFSLDGLGLRLGRGGAVAGHVATAHQSGDGGQDGQGAQQETHQPAVPMQVAASAWRRRVRPGSSRPPARFHRRICRQASSYWPWLSTFTSVLVQKARLPML